MFAVGPVAVSNTGTAPYFFCVSVRNGSVTKAASTCPFDRASPVLGKGISTHWIVVQSTPFVFSVDMTSRSEMVLRAVTATRFPAMSLMLLMDDVGMVTTIVLPGPADDASATSLMSAAPLLLATKNGV